MTESVSDASLIGNVIKDIGGSGIIVGSWDDNVQRPGIDICANINIENNILHRNSLEYRSGTAISLYYVNSVNVTNNDIKDVPYSGISVGWGWGEKSQQYGNLNISNNKITNVMYSMIDGGHIYTLGDMRNSVISGNVLETSKHPYYGGLYNDSGSAYVHLFDNVVTGVGNWYIGYKENENYSHDIKVYRNYSDCNRSPGFDRVEEAIDITSAEGTEASQAIINNAGLKENFKHLLDKAVSHENSLKSFLVPRKIFYNGSIIVQAEDFMTGGEGIGYHSKFDRTQPPIYRDDNVNIYTAAEQAQNFVVGGTETGDWQKYEVEIAKAGTYSFAVKASTTGKDRLVNLYVDETLRGENVNIPQQKDYNTYVLVPLATVYLEAGTHTFRFECATGGLTMDFYKIDFVSE